MANSKWHTEEFAATRSIVMKHGHPATYVVFFTRGGWKYRLIAERVSYLGFHRYLSMQAAIDAADIDAKGNTQ